MEKPRYGYARKMARKVLEDFKIKEPPVDVRAILEAKGYEYMEIDTFMENVDALIVGHYAAVNANHHVHRQRFSIAHELGHKLMNHDISYYRFDITIDNPPTSTTHPDAESAFEKEANAFAGELLIPLEMLKKEFQKTQDITGLSKVFWVSSQAVTVAIQIHMNSLF
jgi:Zn-dependent peptidase ImmA (M78 family)